jgi:hypothetical protein
LTLNESAGYLSILTMSLTRVFEGISNWVEYSHFENREEGYITQERVGEGLTFFLWRVDKEPVPLDFMYMDGTTFVRFRSIH